MKARKAALILMKYPHFDRTPQLSLRQINHCLFCWQKHDKKIVGYLSPGTRWSWCHLRVGGRERGQERGQLQLRRLHLQHLHTQRGQRHGTRRETLVFGGLRQHPHGNLFKVNCTPQRDQTYLIPPDNAFMMASNNRFFLCEIHPSPG